MLLSYLSHDRPRTERQIINSLSRTSPFKNYSGNKAQAVKKALSDALIQNAVTQSNGKFSIA